MLMRQLLMALLLLTTTAATAQRALRDTVAQQYNVLGANCAIFPAAARFPRPLQDEKGVENIKRFTPDLEQITKVEQALRQQKLAAAAPRPESKYYAHYPALIEKNLRDYHRQYYGYYNDQNHPCLYINVFRYGIEDVPGAVPFWLRTGIYAYDGGTSFWRICYDLTLQNFYCFSHNVEG